jgi:hypothetical protein
MPAVFILRQPALVNRFEICNADLNPLPTVSLHLHSGDRRPSTYIGPRISVLLSTALSSLHTMNIPGTLASEQQPTTRRPSGSGRT